MASPYIVCDEELTMIPMKLTIEKPSGTEISCGQTAADGYAARDAKSGAFLPKRERISSRVLATEYTRLT